MKSFRPTIIAHILHDFLLYGFSEYFETCFIMPPLSNTLQGRERNQLCGIHTRIGTTVPGSSLAAGLSEEKVLNCRVRCFMSCSSHTNVPA